MNLRELFQDIEKDKGLTAHRSHEIQVWLNIRNHIYARLTRSTFSNVQLGGGNIFKLFKSSFRGIFNWLKPSRVWFLTGSNLRKEVDGKMHNILMDDMAQKIKSQRFIELPLYEHLPSDTIPTKNLTSRGFLLILETIWSKFIKVNEEHLTKIQDITKAHDLNIDSIGLSKKIIAQYKVMKLMLKLNKPEAVVLNTSYTNYGYIKAFKEKEILVIECQHGVISDSHYGYNLQEQFDSQYFPDILLSFGNEIPAFNGENTWANHTRIYPVGSFYIDHMLKSFSPSKKIQSRLSQYKHSVGFSMQDCEIGWKSFEWICEVAEEMTDHVFVMKTRRTPSSEYIKSRTIPENVYFEDEENVYNIILNCDIHASAYSSCALEAPAMGKRNILININDKAKSYFGDILNEIDTTYVKSKDGLIQALSNLDLGTPEEIQSRNSKVIIPNYSQNIDNFMKENNLC